MSLAPGEYTVVARNQYFQAVLTFDVTVVAGPNPVVFRKLPDLKPEDEARRILEGR